MRTIASSTLCLLPLMWLTACGGEYAWKQGAGPDALAQARQECRTAPEGYGACMNSKGWVVHKLDDDNPLAVFVSSDNNRTAADTVYVPAAGANTQGQTAATSTPASKSVVQATAVSASEKPAEKKTSPDPLTKFNVSSWWKMGGSAAELQAATDTCVAKLGPEYAPQVEAHIYTRGLILCIKGQGWYGLQGY
jgi:hypothetical protein